jgi:hypothetical protein
MEKSEDVESMIAKTIGRLAVALDAPSILQGAAIKAIKDDLDRWMSERSTANISADCAVRLIRELSARNDDEAYRQAVKEIVEQCD